MAQGWKAVGFLDNQTRTRLEHQAEPLLLRKEPRGKTKQDPLSKID
jgi:hypothetical protein